MQTYADDSRNQYQVFADDMELYGDKLAEWEKERQSAIGAAESLLNSIYDNYGRSFRHTALYRWTIMGVICMIQLGGILFFVRRKDVV